MKIGSLHSAKRKIQVRKYLEAQYTQNKQYSDPFEDNDAEFDKCAFNISTKFFNLDFDYSDSESEEVGDKDGILVKPDLVEAEKFISSLKFLKDKSFKKKNNYSQFKMTMCAADVEKFKNECDKMKKYRMKEIDDESDIDENII